MILTPELCRAARALLKWDTPQLAASADLRTEVVERFEAGGMVEAASVAVIREALQNAGLEFIPAGGKSLDGGPGVRSIPMHEPELAAAEEALELEEPGLGAPDVI
jgi:hypothetical protein